MWVIATHEVRTPSAAPSAGPLRRADDDLEAEVGSSRAAGGAAPAMRSPWTRARRGRRWQPRGGRRASAPGVGGRLSLYGRSRGSSRRGALAPAGRPTFQSNGAGNRRPRGSGCRGGRNGRRPAAAGQDGKRGVDAVSPLGCCAARRSRRDEPRATLKRRGPGPCGSRSRRRSVPTGSPARRQELKGGDIEARCAGADRACAEPGAAAAAQSARGASLDCSPRAHLQRNSADGTEAPRQLHRRHAPVRGGPGSR